MRGTMVTDVTMVTTVIVTKKWFSQSFQVKYNNVIVSLCSRNDIKRDGCSTETHIDGGYELR